MQKELVRKCEALSDRGVWLLVFLLTLISGAYVIAVVCRSSEDFDPWIDGVLGLSAVWTSAVMAWISAYRGSGRRRNVRLAAMALTSYAAGDTYWVARTTAGDEVPLPSPADAAWLGFCVLMLAVMGVVVRHRLHAMTWPVVLDGTIGSFGAAAVLAVVMEPLLGPSLTGPPSLETAVAVAYPLLDLLLVATVIGLASSAGSALGTGWVYLVLGLLLFTGGDIVYAFLELNGQYTVGTPLDASWVSGTASIGIWAVLQSGSTDRVHRRRVALPAQTVPALAVIAGLGVLVFASQHRVLVAAVALAVCTLAFAAVPLMFRQRLRLSEATSQARTDELTGLPNRRALYADIPRRLEIHARRPSAVLLLDLDKFKEINDGLGHDIGDRLLTQVAARLTDRLRPADFLARMGGDEFVVHLDGCTQAQAEAVAQKLRATLAEPYDLGTVTVQVTASIGISCYPAQGADLTLLLRKADMAMYEAKAMHTGYSVYSAGATDSIPHQLHSVQALNAALVHDQLILHFQPQVDLATGEVHRVEALVRWNHPTLGLLQPDTFLKRFDEAGLLPALTGVVLEKALAQAAAWASQGRPLSVAVNLSASSVMDSRLPGQIAAMLTAHGLPPSRLVLEITEDVLIVDRARASTNLSALRTTGVRIAVDDFGKGYSSLSYLRELPIDELKLDKSFILTMLDDARATALVVSTIDLAHSLGLEMTAEGVEHEGAYRALTDYGCDLAQGYLMSKPIPAADLDAWLTGHIPQPRPNSLPTAGPPPDAGDNRQLAPLLES